MNGIQAAAHARVSSEKQAEAGTIQSQIQSGELKRKLNDSIVQYKEEQDRNDT